MPLAVQGPFFSGTLSFQQDIKHKFKIINDDDSERNTRFF